MQFIYETKAINSMPGGHNFGNNIKSDLLWINMIKHNSLMPNIYVDLLNATTQAQTDRHIYH